ncbi:Snf7-domain-containing protein [Kalaharituber pfeilii]|nr:Snf7-domain-containing protein [Kalaharituber pfeilii]
MWGWFGGGAAAKKNAPKNAIINLREQLDMLSKRERHLEQQIAEQEAIARKNVSTNKTVARNALKRKKLNEQSLATTQAQITTLEQQIHSIEAATLNYETLRVMKDAGQAMKTIHGGMNIDRVEETMEEIRENAALAHELGEAITRVQIGSEIDDDEILKELEDLEQEQLDNKMLGAPVVPAHQVGNGEIKGKAPVHASEIQEDEEAELRKLQEEMMMS